MDTGGSPGARARAGEPVGEVLSGEQLAAAIEAALPRYAEPRIALVPRVGDGWLGRN